MVIQRTPTKIDKIVSLRIGQHQENAATQIKMDVSDWITVHPTAGFHILFKRPGEVQAQPVLSSLEEGILTWTVQEWETSLIGVGYAEVRAIEAESALVAKSRVIPCSIEESVIEDGEVPPAYSGWVEQVLAAADTIETTQEDYEETVASLEQAIADGIEDIQAEGRTQIAAVHSEGTTQVGAVQAKGTEVINSIPSDYTELSDDVTGLKSAINLFPSVKESDAEDVDLDITDANGNVIMRLANGHIMTKEFDSSNTPTGSNERADVKGSNSTADLVITDRSGNVIAQFENGNFRTKQFNSVDVNASLTKIHKALYGDYYTEFTYNNSSSSTVTVTGDFKQGDTILCHFSNMANNRKDSTSNYKATYYYVDGNNIQHTLGQDYPYNFARFILPSDCTQIVGSFPAELIESGTYTCRFLVYKVGELERKPHIVTVSPDGSKDFTSIREAMDSITDNNAYNTYEIWVYPGTYNILDDYTDAEIRETGFKGLFVNNGVSIVGIGHREAIILHGELDPDTYDRATVRNNISTLNMVGNCGLKNITVTNRYLRYAVHDDSSSATYQDQTRVLENCVFVSRDAASGGAGEAAYGAGGAANKKLIIKDCDLGERLIIHNGDNFILPMTAIVQNSTVKIVTLTDCLLSNTYKAPTRVEFDNCNIGVIRHMLSSGHTEPSMILCGTGTHDAMIDIAEGILYNFGDCMKFPGTISAGQAVAVNNQMQIEGTTNRLLIYGISIGNDGTDTYVQTRGFINSNTVGLTGLSVGDYVTIDSNGVLTATNASASNAVGVVTALSAYSSSAYIKLLI